MGGWQGPPPGWHGAGHHGAAARGAGAAVQRREPAAHAGVHRRGHLRLRRARSERPPAVRERRGLPHLEHPAGGGAADRPRRDHHGRAQVVRGSGRGGRPDRADPGHARAPRGPRPPQRRTGAAAPQCADPRQWRRLAGLDLPRRDPRGTGAGGAAGARRATAPCAGDRAPGQLRLVPGVRTAALVGRAFPAVGPGAGRGDAGLCAVPRRGPFAGRGGAGARLGGRAGRRHALRLPPPGHLAGRHGACHPGAGRGDAGRRRARGSFARTTAGRRWPRWSRPEPRPSTSC